MTKINLFLIILILAFKFSNAQLSGTYTIGSGQDYGTIAAAFSDLNTNGVSGDVIFSLTDETYSESSVTIGGTVFGGNAPSETQTVTIKPATGITPEITFDNSASASTPGIAIDGIAYLIIDGSNTDGGTSKDLLITVNSQGYTIEMENTVDNITIKNCVITGNANTSSETHVGILASATNKTNILIQNNTFKTNEMAISMNGSNNATNTNLQIIDNTIGNAVSPITDLGIHIVEFSNVTIDGNTISDISNSYTNYAMGMQLLGCENVDITNNTIENLTANSAETYGIYIGYTGITINPENISITDNTITNLVNNCANQTSKGIYFDNATNSTIEGNTISEIYTTNTTSKAYGIYYTGTATENTINRNEIYRIYNNSTANGAYGGVGLAFVDITTNCNTNAVNNFIYAIGGGSETTDAADDFKNAYVYGIYVEDTDGFSGLSLYFNSVYLTEDAKADGSDTGYGVNSASSYSGALGLYTSTITNAIDCRNNIFYNLLKGSSPGAITYLMPVLIYDNTNPFSDCDFNIYKTARWEHVAFSNCSATPYDNVALKVNAATFLDMSDWQTFTGEDANSINDNADVNCDDGSFDTDTNRFDATDYLNIKEDFYAQGEAIAGVDGDFNEMLRPNPPHIGASDNGDTPLPVELISFTANKKAEYVELNWITATEINNDYFVVQKSTNGIDFQDYTFVSGCGNSTAVIAYNSIDYSPYKGVNYYRLKQVDFNGQYDYSSVVSVNINKDSNQEEPLIFSNSGQIFIQYHSETSERIEIQLYNIAGQMCYNKPIDVNNGYNSYQISINNLSKGTYVIRLVNSHNAFVQKVWLD